tara:strand:- start:429 stop:749 length:321 start_codon:yes stop_codon:yes gene_type:complete
MEKGSSSLAKSKSKWLWRWAEPESVPTVLPRSKTEQLALRAKLANIDAERAIGRAYQMEIARTKAVGEAMFKSGKALRCSFLSTGRQLFLQTEAARRQFEPGYRNR